MAGRSGLLFAFRLGERATWRLLATRRPSMPGRPEPGSFGPLVSATDLQALIDAAGLAAAHATVSELPGSFDDAEAWFHDDPGHLARPTRGSVSPGPTGCAG